MDKIKVSFDRQSFLSKPGEETAPSISRRIGRSTKQLKPADIRAFALDVSLDGHTFCPSTFKDGKRSKENFEQQQFFALDFDNKEPNKTISFEEVKTRADHYELPILFAYDTLSSKNHDKYRVVFLNDNAVTEIMASEMMLKGLTTIFPEADPSCKSAVQMYYGGKELLYFDNSLPVINIESVIRNTINCLEDRYKVNHYGRYVEKFYRDAGVSLNGKQQPDISIEPNPTEVTSANVGKNLQNPIIYVPLVENSQRNITVLTSGRVAPVSSVRKREQITIAYMAQPFWGILALYVSYSTNLNLEIEGYTTKSFSESLRLWFRYKKVKIGSERFCWNILITVNKNDTTNGIKIYAASKNISLTPVMDSVLTMISVYMGKIFFPP